MAQGFVLCLRWHEGHGWGQESFEGLRVRTLLLIGR